MVMDMMVEDKIKATDMWEINNPRVHAVMRNLMVLVDHSDTIPDEITHEVLSYVLSLLEAYGDPNFKVPVQAQ